MLSDLFDLIEAAPLASISHVALILLFLVFVIQNYRPVISLIKAVIGKKEEPDNSNKLPPEAEEEPETDKKKETTVRQFIRAYSLPSIFIDLNHDIIAINKEFERMTGFVEDEVVGLDLSVVIPETHAHLHKHYVEEYIKGITKDYNIRIVNKSRPIEIKTKGDGNIKVLLKVTYINNGIKGFLGAFIPYAK